MEEKAKELRRWSLASTTQAGSGHPTSCLSAADLVAVLFDKYLTKDDHFILSKGHASPLLYAAYAMAGAFPKKDLLKLRTLASDLEGHPTPRLPFVDAATGSLGQGLSVGAGVALAAKKDESNIKAYVLLGDGELVEGSVWEAANFASYYHLDNLIAIADINKFGQSQETMFGHDIAQYARRFASFGWEVITIDGHDIDAIDGAFADAKANQTGKPFIVIANTKKGKGASLVEDKDGWHGKALNEEQLKEALKELGDGKSDLYWESYRWGSSPRAATPRIKFAIEEFVVGEGQEIATREAYGKAVANVAKESSDVYALDAEVKNSTYAQEVKKSTPEQFIECFIAEQNMVGVALGMQALGKIPFVSSFACFLTRAADQFRMSAISFANLKVVGSHAGVSIGEDGPSQMGLEDIAMFGAIPGSIILHPSDGISTEKLVYEMANHRGISYLRTLRPKTPPLYTMEENFVIGGSKVLRESQRDEVVIAAAGITVHEALAAHAQLEKKGIDVAVIDCYSVKPIDSATLIKQAKASKTKTIIVVEDHYYHGGLGDMVLNAVAGQNISVVKMAVTQISHSGKPQELLEAAGISAKDIVKKVKSLIK